MTETTTSSSRACELCDDVKIRWPPVAAFGVVLLVDSIVRPPSVLSPLVLGDPGALPEWDARPLSIVELHLRKSNPALKCVLLF